MKDFLLHESIYRTDTLIKEFERFPIAIFGAGALGANIAESLAKQGFGKIHIVDFDRVEGINLSTQPYSARDIGQFKSRAIAAKIVRDLSITGITFDVQKVIDTNINKFAKNSKLILDAFDNFESRKLVKEYADRTKTDCLHIGLAEDGNYSHGIWNERYSLSRLNADIQNESEICDYPLARNLVSITVGLACEQIVEFVRSKKKIDFQFTFKDFSITFK